jgi:hypothetical protein
MLKRLLGFELPNEPDAVSVMNCPVDELCREPNCAWPLLSRLTGPFPVNESLFLEAVRLTLPAAVASSAPAAGLRTATVTGVPEGLKIEPVIVALT